MTNIEQKALELDLIARVIAAYHTTRMIEDSHKHCHATPHVREAFDRLAEHDKARHAAEMREQAERFSEAAGKVCRAFEGLVHADSVGGYALANLRTFILAPVDPLVEAMSEAMCGIPGEDYTQPAADLRAALEARGLAIVKKEAV